ncbi:MAG: PAS domain S-box protein [Bacteroidales bacterium]
MNTEHYKKQFANAPWGYANLRVVIDDSGNVEDFVFFEANKKFQKLVKLKSTEILECSVKQVFLAIFGTPFDWIEFFNRIYSSGKTEEIELYSESSDMWIRFQAYPYEKESFAVILSDITYEKQKIEELESFFALSLDLLSIADINGNFLKANYTWSKNLGYSTEELSRMKFMDFIHPDDLKSTIDALSKLIEGGEVIVFVTRFRCSDGEYHFIEWRAKLKGKHVYAASSDITENYLREKKIKDNNERLKSLIKILQYKPKQLQDFLDFALEELIKITDSRIGFICFYDEEKQIFIRNTWSKETMKECSVVNPQSVFYLEKTGFWGEAVRQRKTIINNNFDEDNPLKKGYPEGHVHLKKFMTIPVILNEKIVAVAGVANKVEDYDQTDELQVTLLMNDVWKTSERIKSEQALHESNELWRSIINASPDGINIFSLDGTILSVSPKTVDLWGYDSVEEIVGRKIFDFLDEEYQQKALKMFDNLIKGNHSGFSEYYLKRKDGSWVYLEVNGDVIRDTQGNPQSFLFIDRNITERKQAEDELKKSEEKYRLLVENTYDIIYMLNTDGLFTFVSPAWTRFLGYPLDQVIGKPFQPFVHPDDVDECMLFMQKVIVTGQRKEGVEYRVKHIDGTWKWHTSSASPLIDNSGKVVGYYGIARDISERRSADEALRKSEEKYRLLVENSHDIIFISNLEGVISFVSNAWTALLGHSVDQVVGKSFLSFVHPDDVEKCMAVLKKVIETGQRREELEYRVKHIDGTWRWHTANSSPMKDESGSLVGFYGIAHDNTERKRVEENLQKSEELYRSILNASPDNITITDLEGRIKMISPMGLKMAGRTNKEEILGHMVTDFMVPEDRDRAMSNIKLMQKGLSLEIDEYTAILPDGNFISFEANGELIRNKEGQPTGIVLIIRDITKRKHAEDEIKLKNEELQKSNAEKDKFFSIIAHDLRGPFTIFLGFTDLLVEEIHSMLPEDIQELAVSMKKSAVSLYGLLGNLLEWSRMQRGLTIFEPKSFLLKSKIKESIQFAQESADKKEIIIKYNVPEDLEVFADENMLGSTIRNLTSNAVKFTKRGGEITISSKLVNGNFVEISVIDNGIGMSKGLLDKLFNLNENVSRSGTDGELSTGLGLLLCKDFIKKNGGQIWVESELEKGSSFNFTIPLGNNVL